eukprot:CAMPEP_0113320970 /NCGR_PEP_ID=MMETSP0010_2-20120614/14611_1 /TAXON_ID=216773 ORGANISM="Corethron hystrix, Strain 308" /NCGR_SAMPLE_ID=MMETSP0010_2 /ASSEMBLY_ACC=CAM_ASM_000155 /LENGTH=136 /DNA_ID=CAMNT_0000178949 /DNA_START=33 /DNA_END=443 /DNA_ORIENTATION=+ /assembly_acc=CAM_ASM_000155
MKGGFLYNTFGKTILDASRLQETDLVLDPSRNLAQIHNLFVPYNTRGMYAGTREREPDVLLPYSEAPFRVHHYLGSWESYNARDDARRSREAYDKMNDVPITYVDDDITPWLDVLIEQLGAQKVKELTEGAGIVSS